MVNNFIFLHCLSRKELDTLIEHELQLMLAEGFDKSPISAKALHIRLKAKGIVNGGLTTSLFLCHPGYEQCKFCCCLIITKK